MPIDPRTPVLIGVGQAVDRWDGDATVTPPSPLSLGSIAARRALDDTDAAAAVAAAIDVVAVVRTNVDSIAGVAPAFPQCANPPRALAATLGLSPARAIYSHVGGDQPQMLVNEFATSIFAGDAKVVLLAGAEAMAAMKTAKRTRNKLDWRCVVAGDMEDRGLGEPLLSAYEMANGLGYPTQTYPLFEHALRARLGYDRGAYRQMISELWAGFSAVAAANPYAQFPVERDAAFLATESSENYPVADPYLKWHVAQDAVNQGAAIILTSIGEARRLGVAEDKWVYLHGYAAVADVFPTQRRDLSRSAAMALVLGRALEAANINPASIGYFDLYSCFPVAVLIAAEALKIDWRERVLTVTGGLPFFGGAGNNYSMHAIATMVERLREDRGAFGLVLANGGFLSKQAAGIYSTTPKPDWVPVSSADLAETIAASATSALLARDAVATIDSYTVTWRKGAAQRGYVLGREGNERILARVATGHRATLMALEAVDPIGQQVRIHHRKGVNFIEANVPIGTAPTGGFLERLFTYVSVERQGHVLEVTIDRSNQMNALHSAAHFELHEIWDAFDADPELWVAILTGAGPRAFCSGNDLKATARGADMTMPASGFAGLCSRFDREKPVIAAVNGVAMGGGLEIVLACDLAVADQSARFALPEVRVGLFAAAGGVQRLTRQIGRKASMAMILTANAIDAGEALALGLVNEVVPAGTSLEAARRLAEAVLANSPSAVRASRQALNKLDEIEQIKAAMDANGPIFARLMKTSDFKEGVNAFAEKRPPKWSNT